MSSYVRSQGGSHRVAYEYANYFAKDLHNVRLIYPNNLSKFPKKRPLIQWFKNVANYFERKVLNRKLSWFEFDSSIEKLFIPDLTEEYIPDADIVIATAWQVAEYMAEYSETKGAKFYIIHHDESLSGYPLERVRATWELPFYKVAVSNWTYESVLAISPDNLIYIPNGINNNLYTLNKLIESRPLCVCMAYSPRKIKDIQTGLKAICIAKEKFPELTVKLFGYFPESDNIPDWVQYYRKKSDIFLVEEIYNQSSVYLCSSLFEGFGLPVAEAMACGCAVVTTDCGGVRDFCIDRETALMCSPSDDYNLSENLCLLLQDSDLRVRIATNGKNYIKDFTWDKSYDRLISFIRSKVNQRA